jgi:glucokinase
MMPEDVPVLAIDVGGTNTKVGTVTSAGAVDQVQVFATGSSNPEALIAKIVAAAPRGAVSGVGVSVAGVLNPERDRLYYNPNLKWLVGFPLLEAVQTAFDKPVVLEVDSNAACLGEYVYGSGRGSTRFLCLTAGTGLGGGMIVNGEILRFNGACIGDVGHVVVDGFGLECSCGGHGCAEAFVGAEGIATRTGHHSLQAVVKAAQHGDAEAAAEIASAGHVLGTATASLVHIFAPDRVAIAGGLSEAGDLLISSAVDAFQYTAGTAYSDVQILKAELGWKAPLIGAAAGVLRS